MMKIVWMWRTNEMYLISNAIWEIYGSPFAERDDLISGESLSCGIQLQQLTQYQVQVSRVLLRTKLAQHACGASIYILSNTHHRNTENKNGAEFIFAKKHVM